MRVLAAAAALTAAATSFAAPSAQALPPHPDWPIGTTCHYSQLRMDAADGSLFSIQGGPLVPVTDKGEQVSDVEVSCYLEVVPGGPYPTVTIEGTSTSVGGVAYLPIQAKLIPTGGSFTYRLCSVLTWTDSTGAARRGGSCFPEQ